MSFRPSDSREQFPIQQCPILLSFFCFLVAEEEIDLKDKTISMGDIYTRLVKCLYKKYTLRENVEFKNEAFHKVMKSVGQLALRTLISNNPLLQRTEVLEMIGDFAFDYGLFAGHEDLRLGSDPTADVYVTYPHRSLEEFFGSYGIIQALNEGQSLNEILGPDCEKPIFMMNPLVLKFCLWFLSSSDFGFRNRRWCYVILASYVAKRIDSEVFDPNEVRLKYPAIDMLPDEPLSKSLIQFFSIILDNCEHVTCLNMTNVLRLEDAEQFLGFMSNDFQRRLTKFTIGHDTFKRKGLFLSTTILSYYTFNKRLSPWCSSNKESVATEVQPVSEKCAATYSMKMYHSFSVQKKKSVNSCTVSVCKKTQLNFPTTQQSQAWSWDGCT